MEPKTLQAIIPRLIDSEQAELILQQGGKLIGDSSATTMSGNFLLNLLMGMTLSYIYSMINAIQLSTHLPLFNLTFPANATFFMRFLIDIANFDLLPIEVIWYFFEFPEEGSFNLSF